MRLTALLILALSLAAPARAFLLGGSSDKKSAEKLAGLRGAYERGDCEAVIDGFSGFLGEKPPAGLREEAYGYMGRCHQRGGAADKAISVYKLAHGLYPDNIFFTSRLASIYSQAGFNSEAVPLFLNVLDLKSDDVPANLGLARAYAALGFYAKAKIFYSVTVALQDFSDAAVLREYAGCMLKKGDWPEALFIAKKGAVIAPGSAYWPLAEARALAGQGEYYKTFPFMDAALRLEPSRQLRLEKALYLLLAGLPKRAIEAADAELAADKADPLAAAVKGMALYLLGMKTEANAYFTAARGGGPFTAALAGSFLKSSSGAIEGLCKK
jgi:tetratricopeptide (TPR) repeat protein